MTHSPVRLAGAGLRQGAGRRRAARGDPPALRGLPRPGGGRGARVADRGDHRRPPRSSTGSIELLRPFGIRGDGPHRGRGDGPRRRDAGRGASFRGRARRLRAGTRTHHAAPARRPRFEETPDMNNGSGNERVIVFDTTLRDGEQSPGASMNLAREAAGGRGAAGTWAWTSSRPASRSPRPGDFEAVQAVARAVEGPDRGRPGPRRRGTSTGPWRRWQTAKRPRIHVFLATSPIHRAAQAEDGAASDVLAAADERRRVRPRSAARTSSSRAEDAARTEPDFLAEVVEAVIEAGATTINIPDTVGYAVPAQFGELIAFLRRTVRGHRQGGRSASTATTTWAWRWPTPWRPCRPGRGRWSARSTASASARATARWRRW